MATHPSFADAPPPVTPLGRAWAEASQKERFWYAAASFLLCLLAAAIAFWPRTTPNVVLELALCASVAFAGSRHGRASRLRARATPRPADEAPARPAPLDKAPRA